MGAPRHAAQLATWQPVPTVGTGVGLPLLLRLSPPPSADAPLATQLEPLAVCTFVKPCERRGMPLGKRQVYRTTFVIRALHSAARSCIVSPQLRRQLRSGHDAQSWWQTPDLTGLHR